MSSVQITFRSMLESPAIKYLIQKHYEKVMRLNKKISNYRIVVSLSHKHKHKGKMFSLSIELTLRSKELVCKKENENIYIAIREGFNAIERLLEKNSKKGIVLRGRSKYKFSQTEEKFFSV